ncbi:DEAD/DEAH box helicase [Mycolicibacterium sp. 120266]|uniref:DEAD/DEAH box helicase n=1 Tax=Mycolicibacterium sp. 120266 TaxID=3090601 RepID=UPI00299E3135|nr:DEAD/DEAH box helicase [Mycolicibacterium sp. 120266]MDX1875768.1 DEAD/DEAH box helicase [Mycolicibacterium sp. 120266]
MPHDSSYNSRFRSAQQYVETAMEKIDSPAWLAPDWETLPLGKLTAGTAHNDRSASARYGGDSHWLVRWTMYAELMTEAKYKGVKGQRSNADDATLRWLGSPDRLLHSELHEDVRKLPPLDLGRKLLDEVILPAVIAADKDYSENKGAPDAELKTILSWYYALTSSTAARSEHESQRRLNITYGDITKTLSAARWERGLFERDKFPARSADALQYLTLQLDQRLLPLRRESSTLTPADLDALLPLKLAEKLRDGEEQMLQFRNANFNEPVVQQGISDSGRLEILQRLLPQLARRMLQKKSMLVLGPTSSGKSYAGRIAASYCAYRNQRAIVLLPIKALVTQAVQEWKEWLEGTELEWNIVPGSRDYPDHDDELVRGDFDIAVMIPEKLAALLNRGMRLDNVGVVIADELQMLSADARGTRLEMLLTRLRREHPRIPIIALAAQLADHSTERIRKWLEIDEEAVIRASVRPVPLEKIVRSGDTQERVLHTDGITDDLRAITDAGGTAATRQGLKVNPYQSRALTLCLDLLAERGNDGEFLNRGILCFVQSRDHAERYAKIIQDAANSIKALGPVPPGLPYSGRFSSLKSSEAEARYRRFARIPESREREQVVAALSSGIGFHTARLDPFLREEMEWGFRQGLIRLLFATDTLKLGINLPADVVVVASITTPNNVGTNSIIDRDTVAQRLGRAGRLGISQRGRGYLVIPSSPLQDGDYEFAADDEQQLARYIEQTAGLDTARRRALAALADRDAVFAHYIKYRERGLIVDSQLDHDTLATLLLEHSKRIFQVQERTGLEHEATKMFNLSLKAQEPDAAATISAAIVVDKLVAAHLLSSPQPEKVRITALGRAIGHSGLPLDDSLAIESMADALEAGAGQLTLLFAATQTKQVVNSTSWIAIRSDLPLEAEAEQKRGVIRLAQLLIDGIPADTDLPIPTETLQSLRLLVDGDDLVGSGAIATRLYDLLDLNLPEPPLDEINALLRATVLLLWMRGCPFPAIRQAVSSAVRHRPDKSSKSDSPSPPIYPTDVRALGENTSYVFDTVCDFIGVRPENTHFRTFERMSDAIAYGLPVELTPLARLNLRATHRDRLVHLVPFIVGNEYPDLATLVRRNVRNPRVVAPSRKKFDQWQNELFEVPEFKAIAAELLARQVKSKQFGGTLVGEIAERMIAGHYTCQAVVQNLTAGDAENARAYLKILFEALGLEAIPKGTDQLVLRSRMDTSRELIVLIANVEVTLADARAWADAGVLVIACQGVSLDVVTAPLIQGRHQSVVVEPSVLVETLYRVVELENPSVSSEFGEEEMIDPRLDLGDELFSWDDELIADDDESATDGSVADNYEIGSERERTGERILDILHAAPPLLSRTDANRLLDGVRMHSAGTASVETTAGNP